MIKNIKLICLVYYFLFSHYINSQNNNIWFFSGVKIGKNIKMDFTNNKLNSIDTILVKYPLNALYTNASISRNDSVIILTEGCNLYNKDFDLMMNGYNINPGRVFNDYCPTYYPMYLNSQIVPSRYDNSKYYLINQSLKILGVRQFVADSYFSIVDMIQDSGRGSVILKSFNFNPVFKTYHNVSLLQHGNGKDWWYMNVDTSTGCIMKSVVVNDTVINLPNQCVTNKLNVGESGRTFGFSPDGTKVVFAKGELTINKNNTYDLFEFDRCSGNLTFLKSFKVNKDTANLSTFCFSPNSRYLYATVDCDYLYQYDLEASDITASEVLIDTVDWAFRDTLRNRVVSFSRPVNAPDGKIYVGSCTAVSYLSVIDNPNEKGKACNFKNHGVKLPYINNSTFLINHPNYYLGKLPGCDTMYTTSSTVPYNSDIGVLLYPNPTSGTLYINNPTTAHQCKIFDTAGREVYHSGVGKQSVSSIDISSLQDGLYMFALVQDGAYVFTGKVMVRR